MTKSNSLTHDGMTRARDDDGPSITERGPLIRERPLFTRFNSWSPMDGTSFFPPDMFGSPTLSRSSSRGVAGEQSPFADSDDLDGGVLSPAADTDVTDVEPTWVQTSSEPILPSTLSAQDVRTQLQPSVRPDLASSGPRDA